MVFPYLSIFAQKWACDINYIIKLKKELIAYWWTRFLLSFWMWTMKFVAFITTADYHVVNMKETRFREIQRKKEKPELGFLLTPTELLSILLLELTLLIYYLLSSKIICLLLNHVRVRIFFFFFPNILTARWSFYSYLFIPSILKFLDVS